MPDKSQDDNGELERRAIAKILERSEAGVYVIKSVQDGISNLLTHVSRLDKADQDVYEELRRLADRVTPLEWESKRNIEHREDVKKFMESVQTAIDELESTHEQSRRDDDDRHKDVLSVISAISTDVKKIISTQEKNQPKIDKTDMWFGFLPDLHKKSMIIIIITFTTVITTATHLITKYFDK